MIVHVQVLKINIIKKINGFNVYFFKVFFLYCDNNNIRKDDLMKKYVVKQNSAFSCATACVLSIIKYCGGNISYEELNVILNVDRAGTNAYDILNGIKSIGFDGHGLKIDFNNLINHDVSFPLIAHVIRNNMYHFVVIYSIDKKQQCIKVMDPSIGLIKIKFNNFKKMYLNTILEIIPNGIIPNVKEDVFSFKKLFKLLSRYKIILLKIIFLSVITIILSLISSLLLKMIVIYNNVNLILSVFILIVFFRTLFNYFLEKIIISFQNKLGSSLIRDSISHIMKVPIRYVKNKNTGDILDRIRDVENIKETIVGVSLKIFVNILFVFFTLFFLLFISLKLFIINIIFISFYSLFSIIYYSFLKKKLFDIKNNYGMYESSITEVISNYESVKNLEVENIFINKVLSKYYVYLFRLNKVLNGINVFENLKTFFGELLIIVCIYLSIYLLNNKVIDFSSLFLIYSLVLNIVSPLNSLLSSVMNVKEMQVVIKRVNDLFKVREEFKEVDKIVDGNITFNNVRLCINHKLSDSINLIIPKSSMYLIYGYSGVGKSTILKVLNGEIENYKGNIYIGGVNIKDINYSVLKKSISFVSQEEKLFNDTLKNNIKLFRNVTDEEYEKVLKITFVNKIRDSKSFRDDFVIYEDGINLSGGERQKIILARALLKSFNYLIIDEGLSEVSFSDEKQILDNIRALYKNKTIIYVSHKKDIIDFFEDRYELKGGDKYN